MIDRKRLGIAFAVGVPFAVIALVGGLILIATAVVATVLAAATYGRSAFAGLAIALGGTWAVLFTLAARNCASPSQPCGATPIDLVPHILLSVGLALAGAAVLVAPRLAATARVQKDDGRLSGQ